MDSGKFIMTRFKTAANGTTATATLNAMFRISGGKCWHSIFPNYAPEQLFHYQEKRNAHILNSLHDLIRVDVRIFFIGFG